MYRDHKHFTAYQKQYRQNEPAGQEDIPTGVEVCVMGGSRTHVGPTDVPPPVTNNTDRMTQLVRKTLILEWRSV